jgi:hypothetical protein
MSLKWLKNWMEKRQLSAISVQLHMVSKNDQRCAEKRSLGGAKTVS